MHLPDCQPPEELRMPSESLLNRECPLFRVLVVSPDENMNKAAAQTLAQQLRGGTGKYDYAYDYARFVPVTIEKEKLARLITENDAETALDKIRKDKEASGFFDIFIMRVSDTGAQPCMDVGRKRMAWMVVSDFDSENMPFIVRMVRAVAEPVLKTWQSTRERLLGPGKQYMDPAEEYLLSFTLMFEDAGVNAQGRPIEWDFANASQKYLYPLQRTLYPTVKTLLRSDILRYAPLNADFGSATTEEGKPVRTIGSEAVPFMLQSREDDWHIDRSDTHPLADDVRRRVVNFVVVVPSSDHAPLYITGDKKQPLQDSVFIDGFGAVYVMNKKLPEDAAKLSADALGVVFQTFIAHLREMFGLNSDYVAAENAVQVHYRGSGGVLLWEVDAIAAAVTCYATKRAGSLYSAFQKERELKRYIMVPSDTCIFAAQAQNRLDAIKRLDSDSAMNAWVALAHVEYATGMPATTYVSDVPDEHLYALYLPLFVPIIIQLSGAIRMHIAHAKAKRREEKGNAQAPAPAQESTTPSQ